MSYDIVHFEMAVLVVGFAANLLIGGGIVLASFTFISKSVSVGAIIGSTLFGAVTGAELWIGRTYLAFGSFAQIKTLAVVCVLGGALGTTLAFSTFEPQTRRERDDTSVRRDQASRAESHPLSRPVFTLALFAVIGSAVLAGVGAAPAAAATQDGVTSACQLDRASPQSVIDLRERAQQRLGELRALQADAMVAVDQATIDTVTNRLRNGNISYDRARYRRACGHYQVALNQSEAELERLYTKLAQVRLTSVEEYVATRRTAGYESMAMANLSARREALAAQMWNVSSLPQARAVATKSAELQADTEAQLPSMQVVQAANAIAPLWGSVPFGLGLTLVIGGIGAFVGRLTADTVDSDEETDEPDPVEGRSTRFDSNPGK